MGSREVGRDGGGWKMAGMKAEGRLEGGRGERVASLGKAGKEEWGKLCTEGDGVGSNNEPVSLHGGGGGWDGDGSEGRDRRQEGGAVASIDDRLRCRHVHYYRRCSAAAGGLQKPARSWGGDGVGGLDEDGGGRWRRDGGRGGGGGALEHLHADERGKGADGRGMVDLQEDRADELAVRGRSLVHARGDALGAGRWGGIVVRDGARWLEEGFPIMPAGVALCGSVEEDDACWGGEEEAGGAASLGCPFLPRLPWKRSRQRL